METKNIDDLKANPQNPRIISNQKFSALDKTIDEFGDLSGIVFNTTTGQLVGGHQRTSVFKKKQAEKHVVITQRFEKPNSVGTVAVGYLTYKGEFFAYREVAWPLERELAANVAANNIGGEFDRDLLGEVIYQIQQADESLLELTGNTEKEINDLLKNSGVIEPDDNETPADDGKMTFKLTEEQRRLIEQAIEHIKLSRDIPAQDFEAKNGSALYYMAETYLSVAPALTPEQDPGQFTPPEMPTIN
jgi:hypothetical protein